MRDEFYAVLSAWGIAVVLLAGIAGSGFWEGDPGSLVMMDYVDPSRRWPGAFNDSAASEMARADMEIDKFDSEMVALADEELVEGQARATVRAVQPSPMLIPACVTPR